MKQSSTKFRQNLCSQNQVVVLADEEKGSISSATGFF
jgi:hypothetical protein